MIWRNYEFFKIKPVHLFSIVIVVLFFNHFAILSGDNVVYGIGETRSNVFGYSYFYLNGKGYVPYVQNQQDYEFLMKIVDLGGSEFVIIGVIKEDYHNFIPEAPPYPGIDIFYVKKPFFLNNFWFNYILDLCVKLAPLLFIRFLYNKIKIINFRVLFLIILGMVGSLIFYLYSNNMI